MNRLPILILTLICVAILCPFVQAESWLLSTNAPIEIRAQQLEAIQQRGAAIFTGDVVAKQGDFSLSCAKLVLYSKSGLAELERLEASGGVKIVQPERTATAASAIYRRQEETLTLIGDARVKQGVNEVAGEEITIFLRENRSIVKSGKGGQVRAVIFPKQQDQP